MSFVGASADLDGVETPDFDVCRVLNARDLASVARERVIVCGKPVWVATVDELRGMKAATIDLYKAGFSESSRPQDFEDLATLDGLAGTAHGDRLGEGAQGRISIAARIRSILGGER